MSNLKFHSMLSDFPKANLGVGEYKLNGVTKKAVVDKTSNKVLFLSKKLDIDQVKSKYDFLVVSTIDDNYVIHDRGLAVTSDLF